MQPKIPQFPQNSIVKNKYYYTYLRLCSKKSNAEYVESHHIVPRSFGGTDDKSNLIDLSARGHFIAHRLLTKFSVGKFKRGTVLAIKFMMCDNQKHKRRNKLTGRTFELLKEQSLVKRHFHAWSPLNEHHSGDDVRSFCEKYDLTKCTAASTFPNTAPSICTAGKFLGWVFANKEYTILEIKNIRDAAISAAKLNRNIAVKKVWAETRNTRIVGAGRQVNILLRDLNGDIHKFHSLTELGNSIDKPATSMQNVRIFPHTFKFGAWAGWTLIQYGNK